MSMSDEIWIPVSDTEIKASGDYRNQYWPGLILRIVQGDTEKFFRILNVRFDGESTYLELYSGERYVVSPSAIQELQRSPYLAPKGLPIDFDLLPSYLMKSDADETYLRKSDHGSTSLHTPGIVVPVVQSIPSSGGDYDIPSAAAVRSALSNRLYVVGRIVARSRGLSSVYGDHGVWVNGTKVFTPGRSYGLVLIRRYDLAVVFSQTYDVYGDVNNAVAMGNKMAEYDSNYIIVITTFDEPQKNRNTAPLPLQIARCGGSRTVFLSSGFQFRSAYALIGVPDIWEGGGFEAYSGNVSGDTLATCAVSVVVLSDGSIVRTTAF